MLKTDEWFGEWFDSPYYHILYRHRDELEAKRFIDKLAHYLCLQQDHIILDLACGKGRHAIYLNQLGFHVIGLDLSEQNIHYARQFENNRLKFYQHDMRNIWKKGVFDVVLNLFTSFGYFDSKIENQNAIQAMAQSLKKNGKLVIDFLNPYTVIHNLVPEQKTDIEGLTFNIKRYLSADGFIIKNIEFEQNNKKYRFQEKVKAVRRVEFLDYFEHAGLGVENIFGDYDLNDYVAEHSERMIFVVKNKINGHTV